MQAPSPPAPSSLLSGWLFPLDGPLTDSVGYIAQATTIKPIQLCDGGDPTESLSAP